MPQPVRRRCQLAFSADSTSELRLPAHMVPEAYPRLTAVGREGGGADPQANQFTFTFNSPYISSPLPLQIPGDPKFAELLVKQNPPSALKSASAGRENRVTCSTAVTKTEASLNHTQQSLTDLNS